MHFSDVPRSLGKVVKKRQKGIKIEGRNCDFSTTSPKRDRFSPSHFQRIRVVTVSLIMNFQSISLCACQVIPVSLRRYTINDLNFLMEDIETDS